MRAKKHYWTQVFLVTTLMSCGLGLVCGSLTNNKPDISQACANELSPSDAWNELINPENPWWEEISRTAPKHVTSESGNLICAHPMYGPLPSPLMQPGAALLHLRFGNARLEGVRGTYAPTGSLPVVHRSRHGCTMDATPIAIGLPLGILALLIAFRKNLF